ncbi:MAG: hypothetical protein IJ572_02570 [Bacilli bacterium]|nr:hypothetical protein [Bacilli bacterium]
MRKRYKVMLLSITILLVASLLLGTSYSLWTTTNHQVGVNTVNVGCFKITYTDTGFDDSGDIILDNDYPISDTKGMSRTPYKFNIKNECSIAANYTVNLETLSVSNMNADYLKVQFNDSETPVIYTTGLETGTIALTSESVLAKKLTTGYLADGEDVTYTLRLWIDDSATTTSGVMNTTWKGKVVVISEATKTTNPGSEYSESSPSSLKTFITPLLNEDSRYVGANPSNYVKFNNELWRIVGIFNDKIKLVRASTLDDYTYDTNIAGYTTSPFNMVVNEVTTNYYDTLLEDAKSLIINGTYNVGALSSLDKTASEVLTDESASTWTGSVGTISLSDYLFASSDSVCKTKTASSYGNCANTNYLYAKSNIWTMTPATTSNYVIDATTIAEGDTITQRGILPTVYLNENVLISSGAGTRSNPYLITIE